VRRRRSAAALILGLLAVLFWPAASASAHNLPYSLASLSLAPDGAYRLELRCHTAALIAGLPQGHLSRENRAQFARLPDTEVAARAGLLSDYLKRALVLSADGRRLATPGPVFPPIAEIRADARMTAQTAGPSAPVVVAGRLPSRAHTLQLVLPPELGAVLLRIDRPGATPETQALAPAEPSRPVALGNGERAPPLSTFLEYVRLGFGHILPSGPDHILFVVSLFLLIPRWKPLAAQVTAFTLAHSVTLALAVFGLVSLPAKVVETAIAISIAAVALDNLRTSKLAPWRPFVVFAFGLLHGLGFASVLRELGLPRGQEALSLAAFNIGIELGQLTVLAGCFLLLGLALRRPWRRGWVVVPASIAIAAVAGLWALQRAFA
jgi:hypothetical protein